MGNIINKDMSNVANNLSKSRILINMNDLY